MASSASKKKGTKYEKELKDLLLAAGIHAWREQMDGDHPGETGDPFIALGRVESKYRKAGFKFLHGMLSETDINYAAALRSAGKDWLVVMRFADWAELVKAGTHGGGE